MPYFLHLLHFARFVASDSPSCAGQVFSIDVKKLLIKKFKTRVIVPINNLNNLNKNITTINKRKEKK
jgi:hypothetical protein